MPPPGSPIRFDLKAADTVIESAAAQMRDLLGAARRNKATKNRRAVVTWTGDPGAEWEDALEEIRAHALPVVFVCEAGEGRRKLARGTNGNLRPGEELPCITVDGHDVVAAYRVAHEAIERARRGSRAYADPVGNL